MDRPKTKGRTLNNALPLAIIRDELPALQEKDANENGSTSLFKKAIPVPVIKSVPPAQNPASYLSGFAIPDHYIKFHLYGGAEAAHNNDSYDLTDADVDWLYSTHISKVSRETVRDNTKEHNRDIDLIKTRTGFDVPETGKSVINVMDLFERYAATSTKAAAQIEKERLEIFSEHRMEEIIAYYETEAYALAPLKIHELLPEFPESLAVSGVMDYLKSKFDNKMDIYKKYEKYKVAGVHFAHDVYKYWIKKRQRLGKALIRRFQILPDVNDLSPFIAFRPREIKRYASNRIADQKRISDQLSSLNIKQFQKMRQLKQDGEKLKLIIQSLQLREEIKRERTAISISTFDLRLANETEFGRQVGLARNSIDDVVKPTLTSSLSAYSNLLISPLPKPNFTAEKLNNIKLEAKKLKLVPCQWTVQEEKVKKMDISDDDEPLRARPRTEEEIRRKNKEDAEDSVIDSLLLNASSFMSAIFPLPHALSRDKRADDSTLQLYSDLELAARLLQAPNRLREKDEINVQEFYEFEEDVFHFVHFYFTHQPDIELFNDLELRYNHIMPPKKVETKPVLLVPSKLVSVNGLTHSTDMSQSKELKSTSASALSIRPDFFIKNKQAWDSSAKLITTESTSSTANSIPPIDMSTTPHISSLSYPIVTPAKTISIPEFRFDDYGLIPVESDNITHARVRESRAGTVLDYFGPFPQEYKEDKSDTALFERFYYSDQILEVLKSEEKDSDEFIIKTKSHKRKVDLDLAERVKKLKITPPPLANFPSNIPTYNSKPAPKASYISPLTTGSDIGNNIFLTSGYSEHHKYQPLSIQITPFINKNIPNSQILPTPASLQNGNAPTTTQNLRGPVPPTNPNFPANISPYLYPQYAAMMAGMMQSNSASQGNNTVPAFNQASMILQQQLMQDNYRRQLSNNPNMYLQAAFYQQQVQNQTAAQAQTSMAIALAAANQLSSANSPPSVIPNNLTAGPLPIATPVTK